MAQVSIIVPVYNVEKYLCQCIDSILQQSFSDYELILVDDGSTDSSGQICDDYAQKYPAVRVIHQKNSGQAHARNTGIRQSESEWIMFADSDDVLHPELLSMLYRAANENGVGISACFRDETDVIPETFPQVGFYPELLEVNEQTMSELMKTDSPYGTIYWVVYAKLIRRTIVEADLFTPGRIFEDNAVACKWMVGAGKIAVIPEYLYYYRNNPTGTMNQAFSRKKLDFLWAMEEQVVFYGQQGLCTLQRAALEEYVNTALWFADRIQTELQDPKLARSVIADACRLVKKHGKKCGIGEKEQRKLFRAAHPVLHRVRKRMVRRSAG
ncbi:MAG: glycosyltransferase family 2 protein [Clostridia bacterium]|nr:glycosyltransferase family 2 protein [Clostridia bacterium]